MGGTYVHLMQRYGIDFIMDIVSIFTKINVERKAKKPARIIQMSSSERASLARDKISQAEIDKILDKIKDHGIESLSEEEKDILYKASKE